MDSLALQNFYNNPLTPASSLNQDIEMQRQSREAGIGSLPQNMTLAEANTNNLPFNATQNPNFLQQLFSPQGYNIGSKDFPINLNTKIDPFKEEIGARVEFPFRTG